MFAVKYILFHHESGMDVVEMPESYAYQLSALNHRLHKELSKLTVSDAPSLPVVMAECRDLEAVDPNLQIHTGLSYLNQLEETFAKLNEQNYPLISLLTEIRALQAQMEQWYEEREEHEEFA